MDTADSKGTRKLPTKPKPGKERGLSLENLDNILEAGSSARRNQKAEKIRELSTNFEFKGKLKRIAPPSGFQALDVPKRVVDYLLKDKEEKIKYVVVDLLSQPDVVEKLLNCPIIIHDFEREVSMVWVPDDFARMVRQVSRALSERGVNATSYRISGLLLLWLNDTELTGTMICDDLTRVKSSLKKANGSLRVRDLYEL